jgi:hypothetical protein
VTKVVVDSNPRFNVELSLNQAKLVHDLLYSLSWDDDANPVVEETQSLAEALGGALEDYPDDAFTFSGDIGSSEVTVIR